MIVLRWSELCTRYCLTTCAAANITHEMAPFSRRYGNNLAQERCKTFHATKNKMKVTTQPLPQLEINTWRHLPTKTCDRQLTHADLHA